MQIRTLKRKSVIAVPILAVVSLSACQDDSPKVTEPSATPQAKSSSEESTKAEPTEEKTTEPESTEPESSSESPSQDDSELTPAGTRLKFGQTANVRESAYSDSADSYKIKVNSLQKAPASVKNNFPTMKNMGGDIYYLKYSVTNTGKAESNFTPRSVNRFMLVPLIPAGETGRTVLANTPGCESDATTQISVGQTGESCYAYWIKNPSQQVVWKLGSQAHVVWSN